jgi:hypothetical protein
MMVVNATVTGYRQVSGENALKSAVANNGPVSIAVHVNDSFRHYKQGVFSDPFCPKNLDQNGHNVSRMHGRKMIFLFI